MESNPEASNGHGHPQSASYGEFCNPVTDQEPDPMTLEPVSLQQKSHPQRPLQCMPLQEPAHGSDQQHLTNNQAPLAVPQSLNEATATDFTTNPSNQHDMEIYNEIQHRKSIGSSDEFPIQQPATQPKGLVGNITDASALLDFQTSAQQTKDNDVEQPLIILGPNVECQVYESDGKPILYIAPTSGSFDESPIQQPATQPKGPVDNITDVSDLNVKDVVQVSSESDKEQQTFKLPDGEMVLIVMDEQDSLVQNSTVSDLWVKLATPGESPRQFLRKNWSNMLHYLPVIYPTKDCRWQQEEPEDPKELELWYKAIKNKYQTVMMGKTDKIPTNEEEGIMWQKKFMERCETARPRARGRPY